MRRHQHYTEHREMPILSNSSHLCLFQLSSSGYKVDSSITEAITKYPTLTTRSDLPPFMGLADQLSTSTHTLAALLTPLRPLLSTNNELLWSSHHQEAFTNTKTSLTISPLLSFFNVTKPTRLSIDASGQGTGFILQTTDRRWMVPYSGRNPILIWCGNMIRCNWGRNASGMLGWHWVQSV